MTEKGTTNALGVDEVGWYGTLFYAEVPASDHICNTSNLCGKWCPCSLSPGRLRYLVQSKLLMGLENELPCGT